jgi:xylulose-5-phosphate/fructose-6-phosphate phosphoketolase
VIFAYHGYPYLIHRLTYDRHNHENFHVHGFREEGTTTTPFDMAVMNELDRFHLALAAIRRLPDLGDRSASLTAELERRLSEHRDYVREHGEDLPEIQGWTWNG